MEMLVFMEGGKPENPEKDPQNTDENQQQTQPTHDTGNGNRTRARLMEGECSHHCAIPAPQMRQLFYKFRLLEHFHLTVMLHVLGHLVE